MLFDSLEKKFLHQEADNIIISSATAKLFN